MQRLRLGRAAGWALPPQAHVVEHLGREAKGMDHLVLWLDCDRCDA